MKTNRLEPKLYKTIADLPAMLHGRCRFLYEEKLATTAKTCTRAYKRYSQVVFSGCKYVITLLCMALFAVLALSVLFAANILLKKKKQVNRKPSPDIEPLSQE